MHIEWSSIPSEAQSHLLDTLAANVKFFTMKKVAGLLDGLEALGFTKDSLPASVCTSLELVCKQYADRLVASQGSNWSALQTLGLRDVVNASLKVKLQNGSIVMPSNEEDSDRDEDRSDSSDYWEVQQEPGHNYDQEDEEPL